MNRLAVIVVFFVTLLVPGPEATAHARSESYSHWHLSGTTITGVVTIPLRDAMALYESADATMPSRDLFRNHLLETTTVSAGDEVCARTDDNILQVAQGFIRVELKYDCETGPPQRIQYRAMFDNVPAHVHYAKLHDTGRLIGEALMTDAADTWDFSNLDSAASWSFLSFMTIGIEHIAGGIDHIAFLLGLLLIAGSLGRSIVAITGFTLGHSISLVAAVLSYVRTDSQLVEAFIGFTILLVATEYFLPGHRKPTRFAMAGALFAWATGIAAFALGFVEIRALVAYAGFGVFAACYLQASGTLLQRDTKRATTLLFIATLSFGLVHGFGFASFLMDTGMLGASLFIPLLGFNLGVELGQLILVTIALLGGMALRQYVPRMTPQVTAAALCGIGVYWFVGRTMA